ncbi:MAG: PAS domain S-box protein [Bacteroidetes bacterium]|nr:PAS domain S-box protein [Bacteroidota bacterium]
MKDKLTLVVLRTTLFYAVFGGLWILVSDSVVDALFSDRDVIRSISIYKGWAFVGTTAVLLYYMLRAQLHRWNIEAKRRQFVEQELSEREHQYRLITENISDVIWVLDIETSRFRFVSSSVEKLRGFTPDEVLEQTMEEALTSASMAKLSSVITGRLADFQQGRSVSYSDEIEQPHKDGRIVFTETTTKFAKNLDTGHIEVYGTSRDISGRKEMEEALRKSEERFRSAFDTMLEGAQILGHDWRYLYLNRSAERHNRRPNWELLGEKYMDRWPGIESTKIFSLIRRCMVERITVQTENKFVYPDGMIGWFNLSVQPVPEGILILSDDITEQKQAETALQLSESKFRSYIEHAPLGVMIVDQNGIFTEVNPAGARMLEYTMGELIGKSIDDVLAPQSREAGRLGLQRLTAEGSINDEYQLLRGDGTAIWVSVEAVKLSDDRFIGFCQDTTVRKHFEIELRKLSMAVEQSPVTILVTDTAGMIEYVNPVFTETTGFTAEEVIGKNVNMLSASMAPRDRYKGMWDTIANGNVWKGEFENRRKSGETYWEQAVIAPIKNEKDLITHYISVKEDITGKKWSEQMLGEQSMLLKQLFDGSPTPTILLDADRIIVNVNDAFLSLFGYRREELLGQHINSAIVPDEKLTESDRLDSELTEGREIHLFESLRRNKEGKEIDVLISGLAVRLKGLVVNYYFMYHDISEQKILQKQLIQSQKMEGIGTLAAGIAHDFNNILGIIMGYAALIESHKDNHLKFVSIIDTMTKSCMRGASLVKQLLTFARKTSTNFTSVNISETIIDLSKLLSETFPKSITISVNLTAELPLINADATQLHQVLLNLCVNARDAMTKGGTLTISTELVDSNAIERPIPKTNAVRYIKICVNDTGHGIPREIMDRIFEPFFTTKEIGKGTGLGLSVVFGIIEGHDGAIFVDSEPEKGTTFTIYLPVPESTEQSALKQQEFSHARLRGIETILLVEDEEMLLELNTAFLKANGYRVLSASDGRKALTLFSEHRESISAVFTDFGLPGMDGLELSKQMLLLQPSIKIVMTSGYLEPHVYREIDRISNLQFVTKPYNCPEIVKVLRSMLDGKG